MSSVIQNEASAEMQLIDRILASRHFAKAPLLSSFLSYVAHRSLEEGVLRISEQEIGIDVFQRSEAYDPREDNIVRNYARQLRRRLEDYYREEGRHETLLLTVPKGGYVPVFSPRIMDEVPPVADARQPAPIQQEPRWSGATPSGLPHATNATSARSSWRMVSLWVVLCLCIALLWFSWERHLRQPNAASGAVHPLWSQIFQPGQTTTWVSPDSSLVLLSLSTQTEATLAEYARHDFSRQLKNISPEEARRDLSMTDRRYTSFVDVQMMHRFDTQTGAIHSDVRVAYARDIHLSDLKQGNVILLGSHFSNPWVELFEPKMNFVTVIDYKFGGIRVLNRHPESGELASYDVSWRGSPSKLLGTVAYLPGLEGHGHALIIEGSSQAGGEAVEDYLLNDTLLLPFLASIRRPNGSIPYFELLLESNNIDGTAGPCHILAYRVYE